MIALFSSGNLHIQASEIRAPQADYFSSSSSGPLTTPQVRSLSSSQYAGYPGFLLAVGCFVFAMTLAALVYLLIVWARSVVVIMSPDHNSIIHSPDTDTPRTGPRGWSSFLVTSLSLWSQISSSTRYLGPVCPLLISLAYCSPGAGAADEHEPGRYGHRGHGPEAGQTPRPRPTRGQEPEI